MCNLLFGRNTDDVDNVLRRCKFICKGITMCILSIIAVLTVEQYFIITKWNLQKEQEPPGNQSVNYLVSFSLLLLSISVYYHSLQGRAYRVNTFVLEYFSAKYTDLLKIHLPATSHHCFLTYFRLFLAFFLIFLTCFFFGYF